MQTKTIRSKHGHDVAVHYRIERTPANVHVVHLTAICGSTTHQPSGLTIGASDGPRRVLAPEQIKEELQQMLNDARQEVADEASFREKIAEQISELA